MRRRRHGRLIDGFPQLLSSASRDLTGLTLMELSAFEERWPRKPGMPQTLHTLVDDQNEYIIMIATLRDTCIYFE